MSFLCINHPLECGVCDKSGECELQDKVLESKVDIQPFFALQKKNDFVLNISIYGVTFERQSDASGIDWIGD